MRKLIVTERDKELLAFLADTRACPLPILAERFFAMNPFSGKKNASPEKACMRRLAALRANGLVDMKRVIGDDGKTHAVVRLASRADSPLEAQVSRRRVPVKNEPHHVRTLEAVRALERSLAGKGRIVSFEVEGALRAATQRGRKTARGDTFESFPDAVCRVALADGNGRERSIDIAVEYVTSKYTDNDIAEKHASFRRTYARAVWFADRPRTAWRVKKLTGAECSLLS